MPVKTIVNGQYVYPEYAIQFAQQAPDANMLSVAPYFLYKLDQSSADDLTQLFHDDGTYLRKEYQATSKMKKELVVYEVNLHTTDGTASPQSRTDITAGAISGTTLAHTLLRATQIGVRRQCVYTLAGFDAWLKDRSGHARLWGLYRDFGPTQRIRPTGLALSLINNVVSGDLHQTQRLPDSAQDIDIYPFKHNNQWSVAIVSRAQQNRQVIIDFGNCKTYQLPTTLQTMDAPTPKSTNEESETVTVNTRTLTPDANHIFFTLRPYGLAILTNTNGDRS